MENVTPIFVFSAGFLIISLASKQIGAYFSKAKLPLISGFLFAGVIAGPFVLGLIPEAALRPLRFVDELSLAVIAFAAGSELYLKELRGQFKNITWVTIGLVVVTFSVGSTTVFLLAGYIPFMQAMPLTTRIAVSMLAGSILVARSPSSAIAIVNELRAKGPFTKTALGVTVIMDVVVIFLFAFNSSAADAILTNVGINLGFAGLLIFELALSLFAGWLLSKILLLILAAPVRQMVKNVLVLLTGYGIFLGSAFLRTTTHEYLPFEILLEPLLVGMIASFLITNYSQYRAEFHKVLHDVGPPIYVAFFTLTGASLALDILVQVWSIALILFVVRIIAIFLGSFTGGTIAGAPKQHNRLAWMAYITQAGVGLGLAKEVAVEFPEWGSAFATMIISVIVLNQIVGPPFFKWVINTVGEAHTRAETPDFDGVRDVIIFGVESQSIALARQLENHGWQVRIACREPGLLNNANGSEFEIYAASTISMELMKQLEVEKAEAIVTMLSDEENYQVCEMIYENYGTETMVVRLNDPANTEQFHELGARIVDPRTAIVSLLDHFVRSPTATSLLLGMEEDQGIMDIKVCDPDLTGIALRDLRLPPDVLIMAVHRNEHTIISHGYTRIELGDELSVVGSRESLKEVALMFEA